MADRITELVAANVSLLKELNRLRAEVAEIHAAWPGGLEEIEAAIRCRDERIAELENFVKFSAAG